MANQSRFTTLDGALQALDRLSVRTQGSGAVLDHCAQSIECSLSGYPKLKPKFVRATIGRIVKRRFLSKGEMHHDTHAGLPGMPPISGDVPFAGAVERLRAAIGAFRSYAGELAPHPVFGACSKVEYEQLHAMHVADHLEVLATQARSADDSQQLLINPA
jgi:hypothetical protein